MFFLSSSVITGQAAIRRSTGSPPTRAAVEANCACIFKRHYVRIVEYINYLIIATWHLDFSFVQSQTIKYLDQLSAGLPTLGNDVVASEDGPTL